MLSPKELERECGIIARRLFKQKAWLENIDQKFGAGSKWSIVSDFSRRKSKLSPVDSEVINVMSSQNWLKTDPSGALRLTVAGQKKFGLAGQSPDYPAQHQCQTQHIIKDDEGLTRSVLINQTESPLGWMRARKDKSGKPLLSAAQFEAGEKIRNDFTTAQMSARITSNWDFSGASSGKGANRADGAIEISERAIAAKKRLFDAMDHLGSELSGIVFQVCCLASGLEAAEREFGWPRRSAKLVLQIALTRLSEHYGFQPAKGADGWMKSAMIRQWGKPNFRPHIPPQTPISD